jgi:hypothetical protein
MKIEIDTKDILEKNKGNPILIKPSINIYSTDVEFPKWEISGISINYDGNQPEEKNQKEINKICELINDLVYFESLDNQEKKQRFFDMIIETLRKKLEL